MDGVLLAGRILFALIFVMSGMMGHIIQGRGSIEYARQSGAPFPELTVPLSGLFIMGAGVLFMLGVWADLMALLMAAFLVPTAMIMHRFWGLEDAEMAQNQMAHFMKNMSMVGAALMAFYLFAEFGEQIELAVTDPLF